MKNNDKTTTITKTKPQTPVMQAYAVGHKLRKNHPEPLEYRCDYTHLFSGTPFLVLLLPPSPTQTSGE